MLDGIDDRAGDRWKLLLDKSNLGGNELEAAELTMPAGTSVPSHQHGAVEIIYVLAGVYGHEVNGKLYLLKPGMVGIVRPGDVSPDNTISSNAMSDLELEIKGKGVLSDGTRPPNAIIRLVLRLAGF